MHLKEVDMVVYKVNFLNVFPISIRGADLVA